MIQKDFSENTPIEITDSELDELQDFLLSDAAPEGAMLLDTLDGFFTALVIGPVTVLPSTWLPYIWDMSGSGEEPKFETDDQAQRIMELLMKMMNSIVTLLSKYPDEYEPLPETIEHESEETRDFFIKLWATGFMIGVNCNNSDWELLINNKHSSVLLSAIYMLSVRFDDPVPLPTKKFREVWEKVPDCVREINKFWFPYRRHELARVKGMALATEAERIGRNEPCPCGSGKKFKKCCGK